MVALFDKAERSAKMPPYHPIPTPLTPLLSPKLQFRQTLPEKCTPKTVAKMKLTKRKLIPVLVFILSIVSIIRLLKLAITTSSSSSPSSSTRPPPGSALPPAHKKSLLHDSKETSGTGTLLTQKEIQFLIDLVSQKTPCNLLVFGIEHEYTKLVSINAGGITMFLEDEPEKMSIIKTVSNPTSIYKLEYSTLARDAYKLLKHARTHKACSPASSGLLKKSKCKLALRNLPNRTYKMKWDVVVVDGPCGHDPDCPGRMASIYTAGMLARNGNGTNVVVHDVDRMIEKWFSWEFLCDNNLVSSKGGFWNFRIVGESNATTFCPT